VDIDKIKALETTFFIVGLLSLAFLKEKSGVSDGI